MGANGRPKLGPTLPEGQEQPPAVVTVMSGGQATLSLDPEWVSGFLEPFTGRARIALLTLLQGRPRGMAAAAAGVADATLRRWAQEDARFGEAVAQAQEIGFSRVYEAELYDRALDRSDRGSIRALELVAKSRSAAYRDKQQGKLDVIHHVSRQLQSHVSGWQADPDTDSSSLPPGQGDE